MKRMQLAAPLHDAPSAASHAHASKKGDVDLFDGTPFTAASGDATSCESERLQHTLFVPLHYEQKYAYPLIVWLHSAGDNERQLKRVMPQVSLRNYLAIAPRGTTPEAAPSGGEASGSAYCWQQTSADVIEAQWRLTQCIETVRSRYHVHDSRVFVGGFADGGTMALRLALRMPHLCAGAFAINGGMPADHAPLVNVDFARGMPILLMAGSQSRDYPLERVSDDLRVLHAAGMSVNVRQYPAADELTTRMLSDLDAWIMERVTGIPSRDDRPACDLGELN